MGWPNNSNDEIYDVIHVGAAAPEIPDAFFKQLRPGGRLILPGKFQTLLKSANKSAIVGRLLTNSIVLPKSAINLSAMENNIGWQLMINLIN